MVEENLDGKCYWSALGDLFPNKSLSVLDVDHPRHSCYFVCDGYDVMRDCFKSVKSFNEQLANASNNDYMGVGVPDIRYSVIDGDFR